MASVLRPTVQVQGSRASSFVGLTRCFQRLSVSPVKASRSLSLNVVDIRHCQLTGKKRNRANAVTFSNKKSRKWQQANLQVQKVFWEREKRWIRLRISTKALRTLQKKGLESMAKEQGLDLYSLPYTDARPERTEWLASRDNSLAPMSKTKSPTGSRKMKNPEKLEASKKKPLVAKYDFGRLYYTRAE